MWNRKELKELAKLRMKANYWKCVLVGLVMTMITYGVAGMSGASSAGDSSRILNLSQVKNFKDLAHGFTSVQSKAFIVAAVLAGIAFVILIFFLHVLLINPLEVGCKRFFTRSLNETADIKEICYSYDKGYKNCVEILFYRDLYTLLWTLLLVVPGVVKSYEYRMIPYILGDNPHMEKQEAFALSRQMMQGHKWRAFVLDLSFIFWDILGVITFGISNTFYVTPYKRLTEAGLYRALKG